MEGNGIIIYIVLVFAAVFLLSQGMIVPAFGDSRKARQRLRKRLDEIDKVATDGGMASLLRERYLRKLSPLERRLEALPSMETLQRRYIDFVLNETNGNKRRAADILGITRRTLYRWL